MPDGTILISGGWGYGGGRTGRKLKGVRGCRRASSYPEGEQSTQHQLCVGVNQVGLPVQFLSNRVLDKAPHDKQSKAPCGAKSLNLVEARAGVEPTYTDLQSGA